MTPYASNITLDAAADLIARAAESGKPITILTHAKPDGDAWGSVVSVSAAVKQLGGNAAAVVVPPVPDSLRCLRGAEFVRVHDAGLALPGDPALVLVLDTGATSQLGPLADYAKAHAEHLLIVDHHLSGDLPAAHRYVDPTAAAACEILADLLDLLPLTRPDATIEDALFVGIASDTGWFRFSNTSPRTHRIAATLMERGVKHATLFGDLEQGDRPQRLLLLQRALASLELLADHRGAIMTLRQNDFRETGAFEAETERMIDVPQQVGTVEAVAMVTERVARPGEPPVTAVSFRSKPLENAVNVAELAATFGGGGHARAAGAKVKEPIDAVLPRVRTALAAALAR